MPLIETRGAGSAQGFGEFAQSAAPVYIEDVFSTYLIKPAADFTTYSINNGIDLLGEGGMTWFKARDAAQNNLVYDTARGSSSGNANALITNGTQAQQTTFFDFVTPNANGFTVNFASGGGQLTNSGINFASWTFRKQPKFFDVVTYTGNGANRTIAHNLGSVPGCIITKRTDVGGDDWATYHRSLGASAYISLNTTVASQATSTGWNDTAPTSTTFSLGPSSLANASGGTYVAYLFAHDAGGFGLSGTDNVISCGSFTVSSSTGSTDVNLGYEPQWLLAKPSTDPGFATNWNLYDTMRGWVNTTNAGNVNKRLNPNLAQQETTDKQFQPTATGFTMLNSEVYPGVPITYIYIAIRRGPMKVPTSGTSVFAPVIGVSSSSAPYMTNLTSFTVDAQLMGSRTSVENKYESSRLQGTGKILYTNTTDAEVTGDYPAWDRQTGVGSNVGLSNFSAYITYNFQRAPGFFDVVSYQGSGVAGRAINHNLGVAPELMIVKSRSSSATNWVVGATSIGVNNNVFLNATSAALNFGATYFFNTAPTSSVFYVGNDANVNAGVPTYVAYLFATLAGVSKVGTYTGTGTTKQIDCGFTGGARFVLIKRTDSTGDWYCWDSARGIVASTDPYLVLNSTAAEVTTTDWVDTYSAGFELSSAAGNNVNINAASYIFLSIS